MWLHYFFYVLILFGISFSHFFPLFYRVVWVIYILKKIIMLTTLVRLNEKNKMRLRKKEEQQQQRQLVRDQSEN